MIELFEGRLGGGKTYSAVVRIVDHLRRGGVVCTNIDMVWESISAYVVKYWGLVIEDAQWIKLTDEQIGLFHHHTPSGTASLPVLVVIDEAHLIFNARDFAKTDKQFRETLVFLTQSRKVHTDVIFISQSILNMDKQFMRLVQFIWRFRDLQRWKIPGLGIPYPLKQILCVQFDYDNKTILNRRFIRKDKAIFALYNTNALLQSFSRLSVPTTVHSLKKAVKKQTPMVKYLIPIGIVIGGIAFWYILKSPPGSTAPGRPVTVATTETAKPSTSPRAGSSQEAGANKGLYDVYAEHFVAWNGIDKALKTSEGGWYQVGEMSVRGYVTATQERRARVAQPDGRTAWVIANKDFIPKPGNASPSPTPVVPPSVAPTPIPILSPLPTITPFPITKSR